MKSRIAYSVIAAVMAVSTAALAAPGDTFKISPDRVNLRAGPSDAATVRSQVLRGEEVIELRRDGNWRGVRVLRTGEEGWIFGELLTPSMTSTLGDAGAAAIAPAGFVDLSRDFDRLMGLVNQRAGYPLVTNVRQREGNVLDVTVTPEWLRDGSRNEHLLTALTIYQMWKNHQNSAPVRLAMLSPGGEPYISIDDTTAAGPAIAIESGKG